MINKGKAYISQAIILAQHENDKRIRYRQEEADIVFGPLMNTSSIQTNVPDDVDPSVPRLIFQTNTKHLHLSKSVTQGMCTFLNNEKGLDQQISIITRNFKKLAEAIPRFQKTTGEAGLVITINFPANEDRSKLSEELFTNYLKIPKLHNIASTSVKVGFQTEKKLFLNFESDVYEVRKVLLEPGVDQVVDLSDDSAHERGFAFKVDINNKPRRSGFSNFSEEIEVIFEEMKDFLDNQFNDLIKLS